MKLLQTWNIAEGAVLAMPIHGAQGQVMLNAGVTLTRDLLDLLKQRGVAAAYIDDADTSDIHAPQPISPALRARATAHLGELFSNVHDRSQHLREACVEFARNDMRASRFADAIRASIGSLGVHTIVDDIDGMLDELRGSQVLTGLNSIKSHDCYTFQHSIDVTIMGLVLARSMNWERWRLRAFGVGCMLHDLGKCFIDPAILNKPGKLSRDEFELMRVHPILGCDAIRALAESLGALVPLVALQHHERQNGAGYPYGMHGTNTLGRNEKGMIHDFASLAAVADVYDAMTSARAYRAGWSPQRTIRMISDGAGTHFNRRVVAILRETVPLFPVLSEVRVLTGKYAGWAGVVAEVHRVHLHRPTVRLLTSAAGMRTDPLDIDLRKESIEIETVSACQSRGAGSAARAA